MPKVATNSSGMRFISRLDFRARIIWRKYKHTLSQISKPHEIFYVGTVLGVDSIHIFLSIYTFVNKDFTTKNRNQEGQKTIA
jgi:hypothetical protein